MTTSPLTVWLNGRFLRADEAAISPFDRGLLYGDGIFETMRAQKGRILWPAEHLERLCSSLSALRIPPSRALPAGWENLIVELLHRNGLADDIASVKILVSRGTCPELGLPDPLEPTVCLSAQKYVQPPADLYARGWKLHAFCEGYAPPLARHKSLNYLYFLLARQGAIEAGAHEALILDCDGWVSETSAGSLLVKAKDNRWWTPASDWRLPGITVRKAAKLMEQESGIRIEQKRVSLQDLLSAQTIWVLNSLMLVMPVRELDGQQIPDLSSKEAEAIREKLLISS